MRIAMIGSGYVGLVSGACLSEFGHEVVCIDKDAVKIGALREGRIPIFEPGLEDVVAANARAGRLSFDTDLAKAVAGADAVFIAVGTPSRRGDGHADLSYVFSAAEEIAASLTGYAVVVTKSTVPVGTSRKVEEIIRKARGDADFDMASNPEFLREGSAIGDFRRPDRVVVGCDTERAREVMREVYRPLYLNETPILFTSRESSELIKYAANAFLATKITFINEMADLCEKVGADVQDVARGIGLDGRIGSKFLHAGPGFGGSCFPKDTLALVRTAQEHGAPTRIVEAVQAVNEDRKLAMAKKIETAFGGVKGKTIAVLGLTFKPNTDDMRDAPSLVIVPYLQKAGAVIRAYDPEGGKEAQKYLGLSLAKDAYDALTGADGVVILTEWNEFRALDFAKVKDALKTPLMVDLRNIYRPAQMAQAGFRYVSVGTGMTVTPVYALEGKRVWVTGHCGLVGSALIRRLASEKCAVLTIDRRDLDLTRQQPVEDWVARHRPDAIFLAAGRVGGIVANNSHPGGFLYENMAIAINILEAARQAQTGKLLFLGSSCIYPRLAPQPIPEDALLSGPLEPTNEAYAVAKITGMKMAGAYRREYGCDFISAMPTNLYGPGDNFDLTSSHVLPALIRKAHDAKLQDASQMTVWGSGAPRREFLHVDDCADALVFLMQNYSGDSHVNVGLGTDVSIFELTEIVARTVGFNGAIVTDPSKPDGMPRKLLAIDRLTALGWKPRIGLEDGIAATYRWFLENPDHVRGMNAP